MLNYSEGIFLGNQAEQERKSWTDQRAGGVTSGVPHKSSPIVLTWAVLSALQATWLYITATQSGKDRQWLSAQLMPLAKT